MAIRVNTGYRYPGSLLTASAISGSVVYPSSTLGCVVTIFIILSSITCSAWVSLVAPLDATVRLSGLTGGGFVGSNSAGRFLFSQCAEGPAIGTSPCYGLGAGDGAGAGAAEVGIDGQDVPGQDLQLEDCKK